MHSKLLDGLLLGALAWLAAAQPALPQAGGEPGQRRFRLIAVEGKVDVLTAGSREWKAAKPDQVLETGDSIRTGDNSRATLRASDLNVRKLGPATTVEIRVARPPSHRFLWRILRGFVYFFNRDEALQEEIETGLTSAGTRTTEFQVAVAEDGRTELTVFEGEVDWRDARSQLTLKAGEQGLAVPGEGLKRVAGIVARNVIQWCLYYPAVLDSDELPLTDESRAALAPSLEAYRSGDFLEALNRYPAGREPASEAERVYRAALVLGVGNVPAAESLLHRAPGLSAQTQALRELIAAVKGEPWTRAGAPVLATEWLAESYHLQSRAGTDPQWLGAARQAARAATEKSPRNGLAWARLAELEFSSGDAKAADRALQKGLALSPRNPQAVALAGYLLSAANRIPSAIERFDQAIALDGALANGWLGRGLCRIHRGQSAEGRADLLTAAALEPPRAILRSYLGKAFSDSGQEHAAQKEFGLARQLDPQDPTDRLYAALDEQLHNRINSAIRDLEQSKTLNDNRSVYRSDLLLDQDRAVRSANLARIYQDAGLDQVAFREATRAVNSDYANYSAHLFLANSYDAMRDPNWINLRYETAAESEYLLANLLSPVGAGTLSPAVSQQEYSKLFARDRFGLYADAEYLSRGAGTVSGAQFGTVGSSAYSVDATYRSDRGQRVNNDVEQLQLSLSLKQQLTPADTVYLSGGYLQVEGGDLAQSYDNVGSATFRSKENQEPLLTLGYRHEWRPGLETLVLAGLVRDRFLFNDDAFPARLGIYFGPDGAEVTGLGMSQMYHSRLDFYSVELQQLWRESDRHQSVVGARLQLGSLETASTQLNPDDHQDLFPVPPDTAASQAIDSNLEHVSFYGYHTWELVDHLWFQAGLSYDHLRFPENFLYPPLSGVSDTKDRVLPKAGVIWSPLPDTTVRAAYARALSGVSLEQSVRLEPVQIAGFTQALRGVMPEAETGGPVPGAPYDVSGVAVEQRFRTHTYLAVTGEMLESECDRTLGAFQVNPFEMLNALPSGVRQHLDYREQTLTTTVNQLLGDYWAFGAQYRLSRAELQDDLQQLIDPPLAVQPSLGRDVEGVLHQLSLDAVFNHPSGFFARFNALWSLQSNAGYAPDRPGDDFWQLNAWVGWRFWRRMAEVSVGVMNLTDQDYQLNPLTLYHELPRQRTWVARVRLSF